jgi:hypothetical protein
MMFKHWETLAVVAAGFLAASLLDSTIASVLNPLLTAVKAAPYNG